MAALTKEMFSSLENVEELTKFLHYCVNTMNKDQLKSFKTNENKMQSETCRKTVQNFFQQCALEENPAFPAELPKNITSALEAVFKIRCTDIMNAIVTERLARNGHNIVENFDWNLKWVLGSSKLASIREPICQVQLGSVGLDEKSRLSEKCVSFECDIEAIDKLISEISRIRSELDSV